MCCGRRQEEAGYRGAGLNGAEPHWPPAALIGSLVLSSFQIKLWSEKQTHMKTCNTNDLQAKNDRITLTLQLTFDLEVKLCTLLCVNMNVKQSGFWSDKMNLTFITISHDSCLLKHRIMNINASLSFLCRTVLNVYLQDCTCFRSQALWERRETEKKLRCTRNSSTNASASYERRTDPDPESRETSNDREWKNPIRWGRWKLFITSNRANRKLAAAFPVLH